MSEYPGARSDLICPDCGAPMPFVPNRWKAGQMHYECVNRCCSHGAHPDGSPLGEPADKETRELRGIAHAMFDRLWSGEWASMTRKAAYRWMQRMMCMTPKQAHIGKFTAKECQWLIRLLRARNGE